MNNLDKYVEQMKKHITEHPEMTETEIIRYVYLDLGKRFSFNQNFTPFGSSKQKQNLYKYHSQSIVDLEECMETNIVICKSVSYILEYVLKRLGINIIIEVEKNDMRKCPHMYNRIIEKDGTEYVVDLQEDMYNIQTHSFTRNFGIDSIYTMNYVISRFEQEQMDKRNGYISEGNYYSDDYLYLLHSIADLIEDFDVKSKFILENIDICNNPNIGYTDRQWHHKRILEEFFDKIDFNYNGENGKIRIIDCYKDIDKKRHYLNCVSVQTKSGTRIYVYNKKEFKYCEMDIINFAIAVNNGLVLHNCRIPGLGKILKSLKDEQEK